MGEPKFISIQVGAGALIVALDDTGGVWIFNHNKQEWDKLPAKRNHNGTTKASPIKSL